MGGIGAILLLIFPLVGFILILIAVEQLSDEIKREDIFRDFLICTIISSLAFIIVIFVIFFSPWVGFMFWNISPSPSMPQPHPPYPPTPQFPPEKPDIFFYLFFGVIFSFILGYQQCRLLFRPKRIPLFSRYNRGAKLLPRRQAHLLRSLALHNNIGWLGGLFGWDNLRYHILLLPSR